MNTSSINLLEKNANFAEVFSVSEEGQVSGGGGEEEGEGESVRNYSDILF